MERRKQDATNQVMGYFYQYMFAASECLILKGGSIIVESIGDVTILDNADNITKQYEIKYHENSSSLTSRNIDFWKSLYNWLKDYEISIKCQDLVLYTTSEVKEESIFYNWNILKADEKYKRLYEIYKEDKDKKKVSKERVQYYELIFQKSDFNQLKQILDKIRIEDNTGGFAIIKKKVCNSEELKLFNQEEKIILFNGLYSNLTNIPIIKKLENWKITYDEIVKILTELRTNIKDDGYVIEEVVPNVIINENDKISSHDRDFVKEIQRIDYEEQVREAIKDYFKANKNLNAFYSNYQSFEGEYNKYIDNLTLKLLNMKKIKKLSTLPEDIINNSKLFYHEGIDASVDSKFTFNSISIKRGIVHNIIDSGKVTWHLEDE